MKSKPKKNHYYRIYGLHLSVDDTLPEIQPVSQPGAKTDFVRVYMAGQSSELPEKIQNGAPPYYTSTIQDNNGTPVLQIWLGELYYHLNYLNGNQFLIGRTGDAVWCTWPAKTDYGFVVAQLLGPILGFVLQLRGILVLHASVVVIEDQAMAIMGASGAGKSTTATELCRQGCQPLSDDIAALTWISDQLIQVQAGYPRLRLWPETAEALYGPEHNLRPIAPGIIQSGQKITQWDKRYLELNTFLTTPQNLRAIYILDWRETSNEVQITSLRGAIGLAMLDAHIFSPFLLDQRGRTRQLSTLAQLSKTLPLRHIRPAYSLAALPALGNAILKDFKILINQK